MKLKSILCLVGGILGSLFSLLACLCFAAATHPGAELGAIPAFFAFLHFGGISLLILIIRSWKGAFLYISLPILIVLIPPISCKSVWLIDRHHAWIYLSASSVFLFFAYIYLYWHKKTNMRVVLIFLIITMAIFDYDITTLDKCKNKSESAPQSFQYVRQQTQKSQQKDEVKERWQNMGLVQAEKENIKEPKKIENFQQENPKKQEEMDANLKEINGFPDKKVQKIDIKVFDAKTGKFKSFDEYLDSPVSNKN